MSPATLMQTCLLLGVFVPLASFVFLVFFGTKLGGGQPAPHGGSGDHHDDHGHAAGIPKGQPLAGWFATAAITFSFVMSLVTLFIWLGGSTADRAAWMAEAAHGDFLPALWTSIGSVDVYFGVNLDGLTIAMFVMVTLCSTCIHVFSIGYMQGEPRFARFFTYLSLFCFSMLGLVIARSMLFLFIFWELVGLCSYLLIGFWFEKKSASNAAIKAFVVNRVGDFGFIFGLALCFIFLGTLSLDHAPAVFEAGAHQAGAIHGELSAAAQAVDPGVVSRASQLFSRTLFGVPLATLLGIGLFCGAIGKSAQFPLHVWLPDAMEGPTPVSALIHAATMVAAGVYLVARVYVLLTPGAQMFIAVIGGITLTMAALIAIVQLDIKRVLAYSTLSQLGYMIFAMGVGAWIAALFHLLTHAFFKAMLFLGSGQVIIGCHHEQDMRPMGGLRSKMPVTATTFFIAVLAISGVGIPWTQFGIGGFYSKDEILVVAHHRAFDWNTHGGAAHAHATGGLSASDETLAASCQWRPSDSAAAGIVPVSFQEHGADEHAATGGHEGTTTVAAQTGGHGGEEHGVDYAGHYTNVAKLPFILFLLPIIVAYITPFYMGRCFILTFMGKPRDQHIHDHAHEVKLMYLPLVVLAIMTLIAVLFRGLVAEAVPAGGMPAMVPAIDGLSHAMQAAHHQLPYWVGASWILGLGGAYLVYRNGFALAEQFRKLPVARQVYTVLWNKFYFDELYGFLFVSGLKTLAVICRLFDTWIIDGIVNKAAYLTERIARFSGVVLDNMGVDGLVNLVGKISWGLGGVFRTVQTGVIRNYILIAIIGLSGAVICILSGGHVGWAIVWVILATAALVAPWPGAREQAVRERE